MTRLLAGPMLRYVDSSCATVWVETDEPCRVEVSGFTADTFCVHGHHYALVDVTGLSPGDAVTYSVTLDGDRVWPEAGDERPPSVIRPVLPDEAHRLAFGSCRTSIGHTVSDTAAYGVDMLRCLSLSLQDGAVDDRPDAVVMLGDQVYADEPPEEVLEFVRRHRDTSVPPGEEIADFDEYAKLYQHAWADPDVRWLLSTVPVLTIMDDHDLRDDWNTSQAWQETMRALPWWRQRVTAGLGAYWVYQHAGNLSPAERADDPVFSLLRDGDDEAFDEFMWSIDRDPTGYRWSYRRDFGASRLIILDSRCARQVDPADRRMVDPVEWEWFKESVAGEFEQLLIASSVPVMLPSGVHYVESWNEAVCDGAWGRRAAGAGERIRQAIDLEHWGAFRRSFDDMAQLVRDTARGVNGSPPANIVFLSGDVHYSYLTRARIRRSVSSVYQVVSSPIRNPLGRVTRYANAAASFVGAGLVGWALARTAGVHRTRFGWRMIRGPWFGNSLADIAFGAGDTTVRWYGAKPVGDPARPEATVWASYRLAGRRR